MEQRRGIKKTVGRDWLWRLPVGLLAYSTVCQTA